jgi:hypothetical protein
MTSGAAASGRRFAWTLACGFAVLAAIGQWRGRVHSAMGLCVIAVIMLLAGAVIPAKLGPLERIWTRFGEALSRVTSPIFFSVLYLIVVTPVGLARRTLAKSPLARARSQQSFWVRRPTMSRDAARSALEHLF